MSTHERAGRQLMKGNEAVVYGAILGGATHFFGYPITPASEIAHAAAELFPATGNHFLQAESEVSVINMVYGAAAAGARCMTASSGPGMSLMAEGLSYLAGSRLPAVVVDVQRAGPGLGNIWPEQSDYSMVVKGGGHGNYHALVLAPHSAQEMCDFTYQAFDIADRYRATVIVLTDAYIGQMMEPVALPTAVRRGERKAWAVHGDAATRANLITSIGMDRHEMAAANAELQATYARMAANDCRWEEYRCDDAELLLVAYGISARLAHSAVGRLRTLGVRAGLLRPQTLFPFPTQRLAALAAQVHTVIALELSNGQMAEDVELAVRGVTPVKRLGWMGGIVPTVAEIVERVPALVGAEPGGRE